jgi:hypothetical protein
MIQKRINILLFIIGMLFISMSNIYAQGAIDIQLGATDGVDSRTNLRVGLDLTATTGIDPSLGESDLPPFPPAGVLEVRFDLTPYAGSPLSSYQDYRNVAAFPFTGTVEHKLIWQLGTGTSFTLNYNFPTDVTANFKDAITGTLFNVNLSGSGSYTIPVPLTSGILTVNYSNVAPVSAGPIFSASPVSPLTIVPTAVGGSNTGNVTVSNTGTAALDISGITSSNPEFTFAPNAFPISIPVGGNQVFAVTFTPASLGPKTTNLVFTHNAGGSPTTYVVNGVGASAGPTFAVNPASLSFGSVIPGNSVNQTVTVNNDGLTNALNITSVTVPAGYSVSPTSATIPALGNQVFTVTFAPTAGGTFNGDLTFTHDAPGSPSLVALTGTGVTLSGLIFEVDQRTRREEDTYTDRLTLRNLNLSNGPIQALQFKLIVNAATSEDTVLRFNNITKGNDVSGANWLLEYNVERGASTIGASVDTIYGLLYNIDQTGGLNLLNYYDLLRVNYQVVDLPATKDSAMSIIRISNAFASNEAGLSIPITPLPDSLKINVWNRVSGNSLGDVNGDGYIDILDLINVVDHIVSRDSLDKTITPGLATSEFFRANIAPWGGPDAFVNVQDLALIQKIILDGEYPNGEPIYKRMVLPGNEDNSLNKSTAATVKFYITNEGIAVRLDSEIGIRGAQLEFGSVEDNTGAMNIDSKLGGGYYNQINELLRVLLYDPSGNAVVESGENFVANMPFAIENPQDISVDKIILVDILNKKVGEINVEIFYENAPEIPVDYSLSQNFPNPFNPTTSVKFSVPKDGFVTLKVYDMIGQEVATLFSGNAQRGTYTLNWNGKDNSGNYVSSGSYIYRMTANTGEFTQSKKMIFLK